jgi:hypothetical protein
MSKILESLPITPRPALFYPLFTGSLRDHSGNGNDPTSLTAPIRWMSNRGRHALFAGMTAGRINVAADASLTGLTNLTLWAHGEFLTQSANQYIFFDASASIYLYIGPTFVANYDGANVRSVNIDITGKRSIAMVGYGAAKKADLYVDGGFAGLFSDTSTFSTASSALSLLGAGGTSGLHAPVDCIGIWDSALSSADIAALHAWADRQVSLQRPGNRAYFDFGSWVQIEDVRPPLQGADDVISDGDMELADMSAWTISAGTLAEKRDDTPVEGTRYVRVTADGAGAPNILQNALTANKRYRVRGRARGDGANAPRVGLGSGVPWTGSNSATWQTVDVSWATDNVQFYLLSQAAGYCDFDGFTVEETEELLMDPSCQMEIAGNWTTGSGATITKSLTDPLPGTTRSLKVYHATASASASQTVLKVGQRYRVSGWARGDGVAYPSLYMGASPAWTGTTSTSWQYFNIEVIAGLTSYAWWKVGAVDGAVYVSDLSLTPIRGDLCAYDFSEIYKREVPDLAGRNDYTGTIEGFASTVITEAGLCLDCGSAPDGLSIGSPTTDSSDLTVETLVKIRSVGGLAGRIFDSGSDMVISTNNTPVSTLTWYLYGVTGSPFFISDLIKEDQWLHLVFTRRRYDGAVRVWVNGVESYSTTAGTEALSFDASAWLFNNKGAPGVDRHFDGQCQFFRILDRYMESGEVAERYASIARKPIYEQDFSTVPATVADLTSGQIPGTDYRIGSGTWKIEESDGERWLECVVAGFVWRPASLATGSYEIEVYKADVSWPLMQFIATAPAAYSDAAQNGYLLEIRGNETVSLGKIVAGVLTYPFSTSSGYVAHSTRYKFRITRRTDGLITFYIIGGAFTEWTVINSATDTTAMSSSYSVLDMDAGDRIYLDRQYLGTVDP